jgi:endonuclease YncB( thermonuclease family)
MRFSGSIPPRYIPLALLTLLFFLQGPVLFGQGIAGRVVGVTDGDTVTILDDRNIQHKIRLEGIDAPERSQDFGSVSRQNLSNLVFGKRVQVIGDKSDRYGRTVAKILFDGHDMNLEQVRAGLAWHYKAYEREQSLADRRAYALAEERARASRLGLWKDLAPVPPWNFRRGGSTSSQYRSVKDVPPVAAGGPIIGNRNSHIYHWPGCPSYDMIAPHNRVLFSSKEEAEQAGFRAARNCH